MRKFLIAVLAAMTVSMAWADNMPRRFSWNSDLRPYVAWIAANTRFDRALEVTSDEIPEVQFLTGIDYMNTVRVWGVAAYSPLVNVIVVNMDMDGNHADVMVHELIHFYQWRTDGWTRGTYESREREAQAIQRQFLKQYPRLP